MNTSTRPIKNPIAVRRFTVLGEPDREVTLTLGKPRPSLGDWACSVLIEGIPNARRRRIHGVDAVQALQLALEYARRELDRSGLALTWLDEGEPGSLGLPFSAPTHHGVYFQQRMERYMDRRAAEMDGAVTMVLRERARRRART